MSELFDLDRLLQECSDDALDDGLLIEAERVPIADPGASVKPAVYDERAAV